MGCFYSTLNRIDVAYLFDANERLYLTQSWNIIKVHRLDRFFDDVLIRTINHSPVLRQFWMSKIIVESNNYDYSQSDSCVKAELSWRIGLREYSAQLIAIFDQLLSLINDEYRLTAQLRSFDVPEKVSAVEYESLLVMKQSFLTILRERFHPLQYDFTTAHEHAWMKFLSFLIQYITHEDQSIREPTQVVIATISMNNQ